MKRALFTMALLAGAPAVAAADSPANKLSWKVTDEKGVFGYIIYRAERREGPFLRVSPAIIRKPPAEPATTTAGTYRYADNSVQPGLVYYYFIDVISEGGRKQRLSGIMARKTEGK